MKNAIAGYVLGMILTIVSCNAVSAQETPVIRLKSVSDRTVSDRLIGYNIVYAKNPDKVWESGVLAQGIKDTRPGFLRYPGGTVVTYFHWKNPTGNGWKDSWDPAYDPAENLDGSKFMDVDEYFELLKTTGAEPLMGVNITSGFVWNRLEEGIQEALDLMKYCKEKGVKVTYWYLGNEPYMHDCNGGAITVARYAEMVNAFAPRMKAFDPDIKLIVNWYATFRKRGNDYEELFRLAGKNFDAVDVHWYNMWGDASWEKWLSRTPNGVFTGDSYLSEIKWFRETAARCGYPDMKLASLEWNIGPGKRVKGGGMNPAKCAMVATEMMMQFMIGGLDMATMWPLFWEVGPFSKRPFFDRETGKLNPVSRILKIFGTYQGLQLVDMQQSGLGKNVLTLAVKDPESGRISLCILNKNGEPVDVKLMGACIKGASVKEITSFAMTKDLSGLDCKTSKGKGRLVTLQPYSVAFVTMF